MARPFHEKTAQFPGKSLEWRDCTLLKALTGVSIEGDALKERGRPKRSRSATNIGRPQSRFARDIDGVGTGEPSPWNAADQALLTDPRAWGDRPDPPRAMGGDE